MSHLWLTSPNVTCQFVPTHSCLDVEVGSCACVLVKEPLASKLELVTLMVMFGILFCFCLNIHRSPCDLSPIIPRRTRTSFDKIMVSTCTFIPYFCLSCLPFREITSTLQKCPLHPSSFSHLDENQSSSLSSRLVLLVHTCTVYQDCLADTLCSPLGNNTRNIRFMVEV